MRAAYVRVSRGEGCASESSSVAGQKLLIQAYLRDSNAAAPRLDDAVDLWSDCKLYVDDGYSGMNLRRPGLQQMLSDCAAGSVDCVIVRDLSRLSRNYIDLGDLVERVFPTLGVRFVSIAEGIDLDHRGCARKGCEGDLARAITSIVNNAYSIMLSQNVRKSMREQWKGGDHVQAFAPFGYVYDRSQRGNLGIDPVASRWVASMFEMAACGMAPCEIAGELENAGIPTPAAYAKAGDGPKAGCYRDSKDAWNAKKVRYVLQREVYAGVLIGGVTQSLHVGKGSPRRSTHACEQVRIENAHAAIVSRELFEAAQESLGHVRRGRPRRARLSA